MVPVAPDADCAVGASLHGSRQHFQRVVVQERAQRLASRDTQCSSAFQYLMWTWIYPVVDEANYDFPHSGRVQVLLNPFIVKLAVNRRWRAFE